MMDGARDKRLLRSIMKNLHSMTEGSHTEKEMSCMYNGKDKKRKWRDAKNDVA